MSYLIYEIEPGLKLTIHPTEKVGLPVSPARREELRAKTRLDEETFVVLVNAIRIIGVDWFLELEGAADNQADADRIRKIVRLFKRGLKELSELPPHKESHVSHKLGIDYPRLEGASVNDILASLHKRNTHILPRSGRTSEVEDRTMRASLRLIGAWETVTGQPADQRQYGGSMLDVYWTLLPEMRFPLPHMKWVVDDDGDGLVQRPNGRVWDCAEFRDACREDLADALVRRADRLRKTPSKKH